MLSCFLNSASTHYSIFTHLGTCTVALSDFSVFLKDFKEGLVAVEADCNKEAQEKFARS